MSHFLQNIIQRHTQPQHVALPRLSGLFEQGNPVLNNGLESYVANGGATDPTSGATPQFQLSPQRAEPNASRPEKEIAIEGAPPARILPGLPEPPLSRPAILPNLPPVLPAVSSQIQPALWGENPQQPKAATKEMHTRTLETLIQQFDTGESTQYSTNMYFNQPQMVSPQNPWKAHSLSENQAAAPQPPTVKIHIGRIEIKATTPPQATSSSTVQPPKAAMSLEDFIKARKK